MKAPCVKFNELYNIDVLEKNIEDRIMRNYEIMANRSKIGYAATECFWTKQVIAAMIREALPFSEYFSPERQDSLYRTYLKLSIE